MSNETIRNVADAAAKIMAEALKGNQHKIDKNKNNKIDAHDFKLLRKEEQEQVEEGWDDMLKSVKDKQGPQPSGGSGVKQGTRYGGGRQKDAPEQEEDKPKAKKVKGKFTEMVNIYEEQGLKSFAEAWAKKKKVMKEEPDNEQFTKELEKQKRKAAGTASEEEKAKVAAPASQACVDVKEEVEQIEERELTDSEMEKREKTVKSMKKNMAGFKERYGDRAKEVMYATATKQAKGE